MAPDRFEHSTYLLKRKPFVLIGGVFDLYDPFGELALHCWQEPWKLKECLHLYTGRDRRREILTLQARKVLDFSSAYDVVDPVTGERMGTLRRHGWRSVARDSWEILGPQEEPVGVIEEDSPQLAMARRLLTNLIPQKFYARTHGSGIVAEYAQNFNPFLFKMVVDFSMDHRGLLDRRLGLAAALLLAAVERRQSR